MGYIFDLDTCSDRHTLDFSEILFNPFYLRRYTSTSSTSKPVDRKCFSNFGISSVIPSLSVDGSFSKSEVLIHRSGGPGLEHTTVQNFIQWKPELWCQKSEDIRQFQINHWPFRITQTPADEDSENSDSTVSSLSGRTDRQRTVFFLKSGQNLDRKIRTNRHRTAFFYEIAGQNRDRLNPDR